MNVEIFPKNKQNEEKLYNNIFINLVDQKRDKASHNCINSDCLNSIIEYFLDLNFFHKTVMNSILDFLLEFDGERGEYFFQCVSKLFSWRVRPKSINHIDQGLIRGWNLFLILILRLLSSYHHWTGIIHRLHR